MLFVLLNMVAAFHAYKFSHFIDKQVARVNEHHLSGLEKITTLLFGIDMSRPVDFEKPSQPYQTVQLQSNVKLECWNLKTDSTAKGTVIIFHGYRGNKSSMIDRSDEFLKLGYNTLLVDFMGSGGSEGNTTTIGYRESQEVKSAYEYVSSKGEKHIYLFGTSMGAASIMKAMKDYQLPATALILECPFGSMFQTVSVRVKQMGLHTFPTSYLLMFWGGTENGFWAFSHNPADYAKNITVPTLLMWGEADEKVSRGETETIFQNLKGRKELKTFPLSKHEDYLLKYKEQWITEVSIFLSSTTSKDSLPG